MLFIFNDRSCEGKLVSAVKFPGGPRLVMLVGNPRSVVNLVDLYNSSLVIDEVIPVYEVMFRGVVSIVTVVGNP
jgi:hypothetical protein